MIQHSARSGLVSVIMPFCNVRRRFLDAAVASVKAQTFADWELILIDDGSESATAQFAKGLATEAPGRIRYLAHDGNINLGASASRNLGLRNAKGRFVAFLDSDDVWADTALERQIELLSAQPNAAMVFGRTLCWYSWSGNPSDSRKDFYPHLGIRTPRLVSPPELLTLSLTNRISVPAICCIMLRKSAIDSVGGFEDTFTGMYDDQVFFAKVWAHYPVYVVDECWASYRRHEHSITGTEISEAARESARLKYLQWLAGYLADNGMEQTKVWRVVQRELNIFGLFGSSRHLRGVQRRFWKMIGRISGN